MSISLQQIEKTVAELELTPTQREYLEASLGTYADLKVDVENLTHLMDIEKQTIGQVLSEAGVDKARTDDFTMCWVRGSVSSTLDKKALLAAGVSLAQIEAATVTRPKKDYFQIRAKTTTGGNSGTSGD